MAKLNDKHCLSESEFEPKIDSPNFQLAISKSQKNKLMQKSKAISDYKTRSKAGNFKLLQ